MKFIVAQLLGIIGPSLKIVSIQFKDKKNILLMFVMVNTTIGIELLLLKAYSGAMVCFIAVIQTVINYLYVRINKNLPKFYIPIYIIVSLAAGIYSYKMIIDSLAIICAMLYIASICQTKEKNIRIISFFNIFLWIIYNLYNKAFTDALFKVAFLISTLIAIYKYDVKRE